ncbi:hypothetical protein OPS25_02980 [Alteromonas ponticola]|uniref:Uncharacterized protein n=1 Tax=Alteromonas aquimaris TaxID=2998417 RepID=A0ABT3P3X6_9ALTE|nr:hypothetical protein [Alteromonas aquimaris]MCW8107467.1 hypothetical protein [Alteromonas aquimaris]
MIWFGEWTTPDGWVVTGGSMNTIAYKTIRDLLKKHVYFEPTKAQAQTIRSSKPLQNSKEKASGCLGALVFAVLTPIALITTKALNIL